MTATTCAVLAAVFPIVLLTLAIERRSVGLKLRKKEWFRRFMMVGFAASLLGLPISIIGVQTDGLDPIGTLMNVVAAGAAFIVLVAMVMLIMATAEAEEDGFPLDN